MSGELRDDGTMDTVIACSECGEEQRYSFHEQGGRDDDTEQTYDEFVAWAIEDFDADHECGEIGCADPDDDDPQF